MANTFDIPLTDADVFTYSFYVVFSVIYSALGCYLWHMRARWQVFLLWTLQWALLVYTAGYQTWYLCIAIGDQQITLSEKRAIETEFETFVTYHVVLELEAHLALGAVYLIYVLKIFRYRYGTKVPFDLLWALFLVIAVLVPVGRTLLLMAGIQYGEEPVQIYGLAFQSLVVGVIVAMLLASLILLQFLISKSPELKQAKIAMVAHIIVMLLLIAINIALLVIEIQPFTTITKKQKEEQKEYRLQFADNITDLIFALAVAVVLVRLARNKDCSALYQFGVLARHSTVDLDERNVMITESEEGTFESDFLGQFVDQESLTYTYNQIMGHYSDPLLVSAKSINFGDEQMRSTSVQAKGPADELPVFQMPDLMDSSTSLNYAY